MIKLKSNMSLAEKHALVEQALSGGKFAKISFRKKDGSLAERLCKKFVERLFTSGDRNDVQVNPASHVKSLYTCVDAVKEGWININLDNLVAITANKETYVFEE